MQIRVAAVVLVALLVAAGPLLGEPATGDLVVEARLVDVVEAPRCGTLHVAAAARYEVVRVVRGSYPGRVLYAIHDCSPLSRRNIGEVHRLVLARDPLPDGGSVLDTFGDQGIRRFWVVRFGVVATNSSNVSPPPSSSREEAP